jgi:IS1 family transposase
VGDGSIETFKKLWNRIKINEIGVACSDGNPVYSEILNWEEGVSHVVGKSETCLVESYNSVLRHYLARLHRKTKCYSKSAEMLRLSVLLLLNKNLALSL